MTRNSRRLRSFLQLLAIIELSRIISPAACTRDDSMSSQLVPVLPMWGYVSVTIWRQYDGSVRISWYPVMAVLNTTSPMVLPSAPTETPWKIVPSSSARTAEVVNSDPLSKSQLKPNSDTTKREQMLSRPGNGRPPCDLAYLTESQEALLPPTGRIFARGMRSSQNSTSRIVYKPGGRPISQRAARSAPSANTARVVTV